MDLKLRSVLQAASPRRMAPALERFTPGGGPPRVLLSRLQAPLCLWLVYDAGGRRVTFKSFFDEGAYGRYLEQIERFYPGRLDIPGHERGGIVPLPKLNGLLWALPFDPQMPQLWRTFNGGWVADLAGEAQPWTASLERYNPEIGVILSYRDRRGRPRAFGKVATNQADGQRVYDAMAGLCQVFEPKVGTARLARPLAYDQASGLLLQERVPGGPLPSNRNSSAFMALMPAAAGAAGAVHDSGLSFGREHTLADELARLERCLPELALTAPGLYPTMRTLLAQLAARAGSAEPVELVPCHGDFKWNQLLASRGGFTVIDFELCCQAERWLDVGWFCAYLPPASPRDWRESLAVELLRDRFLDAYQQATGRPLDLNRLALYEAIALALRAMTQVWQHQGAWYLSASFFLDLAIDRLMGPEPMRSPRWAA